MDQQVRVLGKIQAPEENAQSPSSLPEDKKGKGDDDTSSACVCSW